MTELLKLLWWDIKDPDVRFNYINTVLRNIPGRLGLELRRSIITKYFASCGEQVEIYEGVRYRGVRHLHVGSHVMIGIDNFIQASGEITIGNHVMIGPGVKIWSINHNYDDISKPIAEQGFDYDPVTIGDGVWIGADSFILPGVTIPEGCVISARSLVHKKNYPPYSLLGGMPCRVIGTRLKKD